MSVLSTYLAVVDRFPGTYQAIFETQVAYTSGTRYCYRHNRRQSSYFTASANNICHFSRATTALLVQECEELGSTRFVF